MTPHDQHLDLLSVFHFVLGGITAAFSCIPIIHLLMGVLFLTVDMEGEEAPPPELLGWIFIVIPAMIILTGWMLAALMIRNGLKLKRRESYQFCCVISGIECILMPLGTILGVFTLVTLYKPEVKELFEPAANRVNQE